MPFDAGSISGHLGLDISGFTQGCLQADGLTHLFPAMIADFLVNPYLAAAEAVKEAGAFIVEAVEGIGASFHKQGLMAEQAGVSVEYLSRLGAVAQTTGVSMESLVGGFKILEKQAEAASEGDKTAEKAFGRLGISAQEAAQLMAQPEQLFNRVKGAIDGITNPSERTAAALGVLGRQGFNLVPLLTMQGSKMQELGDIVEKLGGTVDKEEAEMGGKFGMLETIFGAAWTGIKKAIAEPVLKIITDNLDTIVEVLQQVAEWIKGGIVDSMSQWSQYAGDVWGILKDVWGILAPIFGFQQSTSKALASELLPVLRIVLAVVKEIVDYVKWIWDHSIGGLLSIASGAMSGPTHTEKTGAAGAGSGKGVDVTIQNVNAHIDSNEASTAIARKLQPHLRAAEHKAKSAMERAASSSKVAKALGGHG